MAILTRVLALAALAVGLGSSLNCLGAASDEDQKLTAFFQRYLDQHFQLQPMDATELGDHRFDHLLGDLSKTGRQRWQDLDRTSLESLHTSIDRSRLSPAAQVDYEIFEHSLVRSLWLTENLHPFEQDPRAYNGYISDSVFLLLAQSSQTREINVSNSIARMKQFPAVLQAARLNLSNPARPLLETAIRQNQGAISFYEHDVFELAGKTAQAAALKEAAAQVVGWLKDYQQWLEKDLLPRAKGEWRLGPERFGKKLELDLDAGVTAGEVLADAQAEFDRVQRDMYVIARQLWSRACPGRVLPPDDPEGRRFTVQQVLNWVAQDHSDAKTVVRDVRKAVVRVKEFIAKNDILRLPSPDHCQIIEMPEFQRGNSTAYMNSPPPLDPKAVGFYAVSPPPKDWDAAKVQSYFEEYNREMLQILTIHEAYPGHYVQFEYANRNPSLIRRVVQSGVFIEGWAVYTEQMMLDQGYGQDDLGLRLTQQKFYLRAVANTILDHRMHCDGMTDEEALRLLCQDAYQSEGEARLKIIRSKQSAVQLSTYFVGRMAHYRLRQAIEREQGDAFNLGRYHEAVLANGAVPVKYLPKLARERLAQPR
jgi:uncharacterized protein (DUF885 family)